MPQPLTIMDDIRLSAVLETPEAVKDVAARYADCDLVILPGETHHFDRCPQEMYRHIKTWLEKQK